MIARALRPMLRDWGRRIIAERDDVTTAAPISVPPSDYGARAFRACVRCDSRARQVRVHDFVERKPDVDEVATPRRSSRPPVRRRLVVGSAGDALEREADRVAADVVAAMSHSLPASFAGGHSRIRARDDPAPPAPTAPARVEATDDGWHIRRNGGTLDDFLAQLNEVSTLTTLRVRLVEWDGAVTERVARHFGVERFSGMVSRLGEEQLLAVGSAALLRADPADPFSIVGLPLAERERLATSWRLTTDQIATGLIRMLGREAVAPATITAAATRHGVSLRQLVAGWLVPPPLALSAVRAFLLSLSQAERDTLWQDAALMATARAQLPTDDYLALLPLLRIMTPPTVGTTASKWGTWTPANLGPEVDRILRTHLSAYVGGAVGAGRMVEGQVSIVGGSDWADAFHRQWKRVTLQGCLMTANAFVDVNQPGRHIWIHNDRASPGTAIHEGIHKYADPTLRDELINTFRGGGDDVCNLDEGITEYFTRLAIATGGLGYARSSYPNQYAAVDRLVRRVGVAVVGAAYFDGSFANLKAAFTTVTGKPWDPYAQAIEASNYALAATML